MSISGLTCFELQGVLDAPGCSRRGRSSCGPRCRQPTHWIITTLCASSSRSSLVGDLLFQLELGQDPLVLAVEVLGRLVLLGAGGDDGRAVLDLPDPALATCTLVTKLPT